MGTPSVGVSPRFASVLLCQTGRIARIHRTDRDQGPAAQGSSTLGAEDWAVQHRGMATGAAETQPAAGHAPKRPASSRVAVAAMIGTEIGRASCRERV